MSSKSIYIIWLILILSLFLLLCGFAHQWKEIILLENIVVSDTKYIYEAEIIKQTNLNTGIKFYAIDVDSVYNRLLSHPYIKDIQMNKNIFGTLNIEVYEREICASIFINKLYYLDSEGKILPRIKLKVVPDVPVISGINFDAAKIKPGMEINDESILVAIKLLDTVKSIDEEFYYLISEVNISKNRDYVLLTNDYAIPIILGREGFAEKIVLLSSFWKQFLNTLSSDQLKYIDARFKDQLVVKWKENNRTNI